MSAGVCARAVHLVSGIKTVFGELAYMCLVSMSIVVVPIITAAFVLKENRNLSNFSNRNFSLFMTLFHELFMIY